MGAWKLVAEDATGRAILKLQDWQLPHIAGLTVGEGTAAATRLQPVSDVSGSGIAVPVVPEVC